MIRAKLSTTAALGLLAAPKPVACDALCSCAISPTPALALRGAAVVFIGSVASAGDSLIPAGQYFDAPPSSLVAIHVATFNVDFAWKGVRTADTVVIRPGPVCTFRFTEGERYIVYAKDRTGDAGLWTTICTRTGPDVAADSVALSVGG
jgi:hypothetical protein